MAQFFFATYEDGVLKPHEPLNLPTHTQMRVTIELLVNATADLQRRQAWETFERLWLESAIDSGGDRLTRDQLHERR